MKAALDFDYLLVNDNLKSTAERLSAILHAERWRTRRRERHFKDLIRSPFSGGPAAT
jgi:guanylate kinase